MKFTIRSILVATVVCAILTLVWIASRPTFSWKQGITRGSPNECPTYSLAQSEINDWLLTQGFVATTVRLPRFGEDIRNTSRFRSISNPCIFVETFSDKKTFEAMIIVHMQGSPLGFDSIRKELEPDSNQLEKRLSEWWDNWIIDHPLQFESSDH